jgi:hypothetical protein
VEIATCAIALTGMSWEQVLWRIPAALCVQLQLLYYQRRGTIFIKDTRAKIRRQLLNARQHG